jgi:hypothetical protein
MGSGGLDKAENTHTLQILQRSYCSLPGHTAFMPELHITFLSPMCGRQKETLLNEVILASKLTNNFTGC